MSTQRWKVTLVIDIDESSHPRKFIPEAVYNSKYGMDCNTSYYMKDGTFYGSDDIQSILERAIPELA